MNRELPETEMRDGSSRHVSSLMDHIRSLISRLRRTGPMIDIPRYFSLPILPAVYLGDSIGLASLEFLALRCEDIVFRGI